MTTTDFDFGYYSVRYVSEGVAHTWAMITPEQRNGSNDRHLLKPGAYMVQLVVDGDFSAYIRWRPDGETVSEICRITADSTQRQRTSAMVPIIADENADIAVRVGGGDGTLRRAAVRIFADPSFNP